MSSINLFGRRPAGGRVTLLHSQSSLALQPLLPRAAAAAAAAPPPPPPPPESTAELTAAPPSVLAPSPDTALAAPAAPAATVPDPRKRSHRDSKQARKLGWFSNSRRRKKAAAKKVVEVEEEEQWEGFQTTGHEWIGRKLLRVFDTTVRTLARLLL